MIQIQRENIPLMNTVDIIIRLLRVATQYAFEKDLSGTHDTFASMTPKVDVSAPHSVCSSSVVQAILQHVIYSSNNIGNGCMAQIDRSRS